MTQFKFAADLSVSEFPLLYDWATRTVMQETPDGSSPYEKPPVHHPQILFCQDVLPTQAGYKSVSYKSLIGAQGTNTNFSQVYTVSDVAQNKALIGITLDSRIFILTSALPTWVEVTPVGWGGGDQVFPGVVNGISYLYLSGFGCYQVVITTASLTAVTLLGITPANIRGLSSSVDYLILWDAVGTVYWSSTINPLDFVPSLITGAGSAVPYDLSGKIVVIVPLNNGFVVYTNQNIVLASFSNNTQFPWIFRNANNGSGISALDQVTVGHDLGFHVACTYAGILQVTPQGCTVIVPELTDFISARVYESWDPVGQTIVKTLLSSTVVCRVAALCGRWIVLSYGQAGAAGTVDIYTDAVVYDSGLKRWGKLHINHTCVFEVETNMEGVVQAYTAASEVGQSYASATPQTYNSTAVNISLPPQIGRTFGIVQQDGTVLLANMNFSSNADAGVLVLGKYQATRTALLELEEIAVESIPTILSNFSVFTVPSINGRDLLAPVIPTMLEDGLNVQRYGLRSVGKNHLIVFTGSFNLTSVEVTGIVDGRR